MAISGTYRWLFNRLHRLSDFFHEGGIKSLFTKFGLAPVSTKLVTVSMAFDEISADTRRPYFPLRTNDTNSYRTSSHSTVILYGPFRASVQRFSFADASLLSVLSTFESIGATLISRVWVSID